jgi:hypothetical protein
VGGGAVIANSLADSENPDMQRRIPNKLPRPHLLEQFVFGHNTVAVRQQIGQDVAFLGPQRYQHAGPLQLIALGVEEIVTKTVAHRLFPLALRSRTTSAG